MRIRVLHGGYVVKHLPSRPNLDHLRGQAKKVLADLKKRNPKAKLADAQLQVARDSGFKSWPALAKHVEQLRLLEGEWRFVGLQVDGSDMPAAVTAQSRILMDGDRFRTESPEANYEGVFTIDASTEPMRIDIEFVEGPEAGNWSYGIYELNGDQLTICLGLTGAQRPRAFATKKDSGHALEKLRRASSARPANVTGGTRSTKSEEDARLKARAPEAARGPEAARAPDDVAKSFDVPMTPLLKKMQGEW